MKQVWRGCMILLIFLLGSACTAWAAEPIPIRFRKAGGGQFIYCNNPENINEWRLSSDENEYATYMMKNEGLGPGRYSVFFCFYNTADFDIEPDIEVVSDDATITINAIGYYLPQGKEYFDCLGAWSDFLGINIRTMNEYRQFVPYQPLSEAFPKTIQLKGESDWISRYIYNYDVLKPRTTFLMLVDFTIDEGEADVNFTALKHYGILKDRTHHNPNAAPGAYYKDTSVKGIDTQTLPMVECDLNVQIDSEMRDGEPVMVEIYNQFHNEGNVVPHWMTNINPARDAYLFSKNVAAGSDMLELEYQDDSKLDYYGKNVPLSQRDNIWRMDIYHHDTVAYQAGMPWQADTYIPNAPSGKTLDINNLPNLEWEFNLGNFGVTNRYHLTVTNSDSRERVVNYMLETVYASNIVMVRDEDGNLLNPYTLEKEGAFALSKGLMDTKKEDCMASIPVAPGETKKYIIDVIEPTNCYGGILQSLKVDSYKYLKEEEALPFPQYIQRPVFENVFFNGSEYMKWENGMLYRLGEQWEKIDLPSGTEAFFQSRYKDYSIVKTDFGYAVRFSGWDEYTPGYIGQEDTKNKLYLFDEDFNYLSSHTFPEYLHDMSFFNGNLYILSDKSYRTTDGSRLTPLPAGERIPVVSGSCSVVQKQDGIYLRNANSKDMKISFEGAQPGDIQNAGDLFYYQKSWKKTYADPAPNILSLSADGINWTDYILPDRFLSLKNVLHMDQTIYIDCKYEQFAFSDEDIAFDPVNVVLKGEALAFQTPAEVLNDRTMVPARWFFEKIGAEVTWDAMSQQVYVVYQDKEVEIKIGSDTASVDGTPCQLDAPAYLKDDKTMVPLRFLSETMGYQVEWDEGTRTAFIC